MLFGDLLSLGSGFFWALTNILIKRSKLVGASAEKLLLYQTRRCGNRWNAGAASPVPIRDPAVLPTMALLFQAVYVVAFTYVLWFWLLRRYRHRACRASPSCHRYFGAVRRRDLE
jgi:drug/metabolite transporter (DMT)-like permease